jgi:hypothetical protein
VVLTGFNTDIEHSGTTYHVQTEDKGNSNPVVESLVYARGEILYSRRTPYHDLVEQEVDKEAIAALMEKQHRAIVEAVADGGLDRLAAADDEVANGEDTTITHGQDEKQPGGQEEPTLDQVILDYLEAQRGRAHLILRAAGDHDFVYGDTAEINVTAVDSHAQDAQAGVRVSVLFKSTADPRRLVLVEGETDESGSFAAEATVPDFNGGTSAVVIVAESELGQSEIKHLVHR